MITKYKANQNKTKQMILLWQKYFHQIQFFQCWFYYRKQGNAIYICYNFLTQIKMAQVVDIFCLIYPAYTQVADDFVPCIARATPAKVVTSVSQNFLLSALEVL